MHRECPICHTAYYVPDEMSLRQSCPQCDALGVTGEPSSFPFDVHDEFEREMYLLSDESAFNEPL